MNTDNKSIFNLPGLQSSQKPPSLIKHGYKSQNYLKALTLYTKWNLYISTTSNNFNLVINWRKMFLQMQPAEPHPQSAESGLQGQCQRSALSVTPPGDPQAHGCWRTTTFLVRFIESFWISGTKNLLLWGLCKLNVITN